jgi:hypothetical protein
MAGEPGAFLPGRDSTSARLHAPLATVAGGACVAFGLVQARIALPRVAR